jgi:pyridoxal phosphate-dependent aminotransferase EpsN
LGRFYKGIPSGYLGYSAAFSFNGNKIITGSSGGMLISRDKKHTEKARFWSNQSRDLDPLNINNYVYSEQGYNYRISNLLAGIARGQLGSAQRKGQAASGRF